MKNFLFLIFCFLLIFSCKKDENSSKIFKSDLPNFSNVKLDDVFTKEEGKLENGDSAIAKVDDYYKNVWENGDLWGGFLIAKGNTIIYEKYRGFSQENNQNPIENNTPLHVASISKTLTAMATLKLVEAGKLNLNDDLSKFFPKFPYPGITVKNLLTQRSGLPKYEYFVDHIDPLAKELSKDYLKNEDVVNLLIKYKPPVSRLPNTGFEYCNTNFALLALIIEKATKTPFPKAMDEMVFQPLEMKNSFIFQKKNMKSAARSFYQRGPKVYPYDRLDLIYGDKNVYTTPRDLLNFSIALYSKDFLREDLKAMIFEPFSNEKAGVNNYGIGFRMKIFDENSKLTYHNGWWHGTNSVFAHLLDSKVTIIAIGNKFSRRVYSALSLSALFENLPYEAEKFNKAIGETEEPAKVSDSTNVYSE
ncbi:serine hydrolase domain-containing protein [Frigoriflavimonas asaccharolytica]|uniref:CubicO group peptidase (Beta-lactamase class C family) n=1 Tax=Frigoriflavimonas asaccharolytica TaxID=2735899 RepID=A0A8J8G940_9FLAO|nr:serine hydrolase domain-containing protein [Frigoriflavimonas asaccharolytica]NRS92217.1 CubicO group peptidase (beta-lactamase class C family) [Frigoriflavimonas asaccharolytica]